MDTTEYVRGYLAALRDLSGRQSLERWRVIALDAEGAAVRSREGPEWIDQEIGRLQERFPESPAPKPGAVYVAEDGAGRLKIGYTAQPVEKRIRQLADATGLQVSQVASFAGSRQDEKDAHARFEQWRLRGEWFADRQPIREWALARA